MCVSCSVTSSFATPWTVAHQAPLSIEFSRQEYCSKLPFPTPEDYPDPGMKLVSLVSPASPELAGGFFTTTSPILRGGDYKQAMIIECYKCYDRGRDTWSSLWLRVEFQTKLPKWYCLNWLSSEAVILKNYPDEKDQEIESWGEDIPGREKSMVWTGNTKYLLLLFSHSVMSGSLWLHGLLHTRLPCPSPSTGVCSN